MMKRFLWVVNALPIVGVVAIALYVGVNQWSQSNQAIGAAPQVPSAQVPASEVSNTEWGTVESVSDGDTLKVMLDGKEIKVRLCGVDAPEKAQPSGEEAKAFLEKLVQNAGGRVGLVETDTDRYGRMVAEVFFVLGETEQSAQEELLKAGMVYVYPQYVGSCPNGEVFKRVEAIAQRSKAGVWARNNERPWDYRRNQRN
jgi:endonuclease YncB( thermonuclease family)